MSDETLLETAERQAREDAERIASQRSMIAELRNAVENAERFLGEFEEAQARYKKALAEVKAALSAAPGNDN